MKKVFLVFLLASTSILLSSFGLMDNSKESNRGAEGSPVVYDFYNIDLGAYGCTYNLYITVEFSTGFGTRTRTVNNTLNPGDTWNLVIAKAKNEVVVSESVQIVGIMINETFPMRYDQWFGGQSCNSDASYIGTCWLNYGNNYFEFGENLIVGKE